MIVYLITNRIDGKQYVGQHSGSDLQKYWLRHKYLAINNYNKERYLYRAICKHGFENFEIKPLVIVESKWEMDLYEKGLIKSFNTKSPNGYNLTDGGEGVIGLPKELLEKRARKISKSLMGNQNCLGRFESEETRKKKSEVNKGNKNALGAIRTPEYCKQKSESQIGRKFSEETIKRMSEAAKKRKDSEETRLKKSESAKKLGLCPPRRSHEELVKSGISSCHKRYHINRNIVNPQCVLCKEATNVLVSESPVKKG